MATESRKLSFAGASGATLAGRLELPEASPAAFAVFAHCFTCSKDVAAASRISRALCAEGFAVLRFDFTGLGNSEGDFSHTNFTSNVEDLVAAAEFLAREHRAPRLLIGHSLGGAAVLAAAGRLPLVAAVATIGAPSDTDHIRHLFAGNLDAIEADGSAMVNLAGRPFEIRKQFLQDISGQGLLEKVGAMKKALLIFHAPLDELVDLDHARRIYLAAKHPKSFIALDGADHLLTRKEDSEYVARLLAVWASRYTDAGGA